MAWMESDRARTLLGGSDRKSWRMSIFQPRMVLTSDGVALARSLEIERRLPHSIESARIGSKLSRWSSNARNLLVKESTLQVVVEEVVNVDLQFGRAVNWEGDTEGCGNSKRNRRGFQEQVGW
jgi:hypothetical protein